MGRGHLEVDAHVFLRRDDVLGHRLYITTGPIQVKADWHGPGAAPPCGPPLAGLLVGCARAADAPLPGVPVSCERNRSYAGWLDRAPRSTGRPRPWPAPRAMGTVRGGTTWRAASGPCCGAWGLVIQFCPPAGYLPVGVAIHIAPSRSWRVRFVEPTGRHGLPVAARETP